MGIVADLSTPAPAVFVSFDQDMVVMVLMVLAAFRRLPGCRCGALAVRALFRARVAASRSRVTPDAGPGARWSARGFELSSAPGDMALL